MKVVEEIRAKVLKAKQKRDTRSEELYLTDIVGIYVIGGKGSWEAADALYYNRLDKLIKRASSNTLKALVKRLD